MRIHGTLRRCMAILLVLAMCLSVFPLSVFAADAGTYTKITTASELVTGKYVMVLDTGYAPTVLDGSWVLAAQPAVEGDTVTDAAGAVWTLTVDGSSVKLTDSNGVSVAPSGGNNNGIKSGDYSWAWAFADGKVTFNGTGEDTVVLASNAGSQNRFRAYKTSTVSGNPNGYPSTFTLYKLSEGTTEPEPTTEPSTTPSEPEATVVSISAALAASEGEFTVKGVVTLVDGQNIYVQDATGGICVRMSSAPSDIALGDTIIGTGSKTTYNGLPQLGSGTYEKSSGLTLTAKETTIGALTTADICTYVKLTGVEVTEVNDNNGAYSTPNITVSDGTNIIQLYKAVVGKTDGAWDVKVGDKLDITAAVGVYNTTLQLRNTLASEIAVTSSTTPTPDPDPEPTPDPAGSTATLVTDVTTLAAGDQIIIVASDYNFAMSTTQNNNNRGRTEITKSEDGVTVTYGEDTQIITLETGAVEGTFGFNVGGQYLYAASSSSNYLRSGSELNANASWLIEIQDGIATVKAQGSNTRNWLRHNNGNGIFSCYTTQQTDISIYKLGSAEPEKPDAPWADEDAKYSIYEQVAELKDGDVVVIYNPGNAKALSSQDSSYYKAGVDAAVTENYIASDADYIEWTVSVDENGVYSFKQGEEHTLGIEQSGTYFNLKTNAGDTGWTLEPIAEGSSLYYLYSSTLTGTYGNVYLEWYASRTAFSAYCTGVGRLTEKDFGFGFYKLVREGVEEEEPEKPAVSIKDGDQVVIYAPAYNKALSTTKTGNYNVGVDVAVEGGVMTGYGETEIWTVIDNGDGTWSFANGGQNIAMGTSYSSMNLGEVNDKWELTALGDGLYNIRNTGRGNYMEWYASYNNWSTYNSASAATDPQFQLSFYVVTGDVPTPVTGVADGDYVIWAPAYSMALSTTYGGFYNNGVALTVDGDKISGYNSTEVWTVTNNDDSTITISCSGGKLAMGTGYSSMPLNEVNDTWVLEDAGNGLWYVKNVGRSCYIEWYEANKNWSGYAYINSGSEGLFALKFTPVEKGYETDAAIVEDIAQWGGMPKPENTTSVAGDKYVAGDEKDTEDVFTAVVSGANVTPWTKGGSNDAPLYYMGGTGLGSGSNDYLQFAVNAAGWGDMELSFRIRSSNSGPGSFQLQYSADGGATFQNFTTGSYAYAYTAWNSEGSYPVTGEGAVTDGIAKPSLAAANYVSFVFDVPAGADNCGNLIIRLVPGTDRANGASGTVSASGTVRIDTVVLSGSPIADDSITGYVTVTPNGEEDQPVGTELTMTSATEGATIHYRVDGGAWQTYDPANKPTLSALPCNVEAYASSQGKADSVTLLYRYAAGTVESVKFSPNGGGLYIPGESAEITLSTNTADATIYYATSADGEVFGEYAVYTDPIVVNKGFGKLVIKAYAEKEGFNSSAEVTRTFTERISDTYGIYFGQLHSHTNISDGSGSVSEAFAHASEVKNLDFLAVTDHSNSFDNEGSGVLNQDGTAISSEWKEGHEAAAAITDEDFVGIYGFEMTWSNGLGHLNTFNTPGWQSRTQSQFTTQSTALQNYYAALATVPESISQFNHPGTTFGDFSDFAHYSEGTDSLITLIEVGNGEGAIGSSGYFPSYEYYTRALDKGWHVAPTNNQDNHKGLWGDSNTGRSVILADSLTEESIYDALRNYRVYATEDNDLQIYYSLNGSIMGSQLEISDVEETVSLSLKVNDPTDSAIGRVEVIVNGGLSIATQTVSASSQNVAFSVSSDYNYYYIKITQPDGDIAVTAPVWVGQVEAVGISSLRAESALTIAGEEQTFTMELFNNESKALEIDSVVFTNKATGDVIHTDTSITSVPKEGTASCSFPYTFAKDGVYTITATVKGTLNGVSKTYTKDLELTVMPRNVTSNVIVDGTHYNDYVTGYYGGNTANMTTIAAEQGIQVHVETEKITPEMLEDCSLLVISAPAKKSGTANAGAYVAKPFEDDFIAMVADYVKAGGNVIVCGLADYQDKGAASSDHHTAAQINKLLAAIGSTMTINDDEAYDEEKNGGQAYRLYPEIFNTESQWTKGIAEGQTYSQYSGCTVNPGSGTWLVKGFDSTYSIDSDNDGIGGIGKGEAVFLAAEETPYGGTIFAAGGVFISDFEVKAEMDNIWDLPYANRTIYENILGITRTQPEVTPIEEVRKSAQEGLGSIFVIEGYVTAGTANEDTKFFDAIYVQDETGGITVFPYAELGLELGTKMRITGYTDAYQGDIEIQIMSYEILDEPKNVIVPEKMSNKDAMDYAENGGELIQVEGEVVSVILTSDGKGVAQFEVKDANGDIAKVFIDGYILSGTTGKNELASIVKVGNTVSAVGLLYMHPEGDSTDSVAVLRVRDCDEVVLIKEGESTKPTEPTEPSESSKPTEATKPSETTKPTETTKPSNGKNVNTGDDFPLVQYVCLVTASLIALAVLLWNRKKYTK